MHGDVKTTAHACATARPAGICSSYVVYMNLLTSCRPSDPRRAFLGAAAEPLVVQLAPCPFGPPPAGQSSPVLRCWLGAAKLTDDDDDTLPVLRCRVLLLSVIQAQSTTPFEPE